MAMGKRRRHAKQASMWVATQDLPRSGLQGRLVAVVAALLVLIRFLWEPMRRPERLARPASRRERRSTAVNLIVPGGVSEMAFTTGS